MTTIEQIKQLREETAVSITECKKALEQADNDFSKAKDILRKMGKDLAQKRSNRDVRSGLIHSYIHPNKKIGVLLEINCETDFVANGNDFENLAHELCLQIAAVREDTPLIEQKWIKDTSKTIKDVLDEYFAKLGENIVIKNFVRYEI